MGGIFINYRSEDSEIAAVLIDRELTTEFGSGRVFLDSRSIPAGVDFVEELLGRLRACSVLLVLIGPRWLTLTDATDHRRIDDPEDWVRREIAEAFTHGLRVIPVLTDGAQLPAEVDLPADIAGLSRRQHVLLRSRYTNVDLKFLVEQITNADPELGKFVPKQASSSKPAAFRPAVKGPMRIRQPMLFIGLGGAGCKVGAELEKRLRGELCGPDGTWLLDDMADPYFVPYQLPSCLQFVYADLSADELRRVRHEVVPSWRHEQAAQKTMHLITDLVPIRLANVAELVRGLRINTNEEIIHWLPPIGSEPRIGPLVRGTGQLPTVGRCMLFEAVRRNPDIALLDIKEALADINESGGDLFIVSGKRTQRVEPMIVFVVFSVVGGTGSGVYYDYLHLIGDLMQRGAKEAEIYPLVLLPSAFDDGQGGGRPAELNAGSALVDLFRLIDDQHAEGSLDELYTKGRYGASSVHYPHLGHVQLPPNMVQTAFLFGRPGGMRRDDLNRSMVSLMVSLIGARPTEQDDDNDGVNLPYQSFAGGFINSTVEPYAAAYTSVGQRGATTSTVAVLTTPLLEVTDIISSHLLANAINELLVPPNAAEKNKPHIRQFITAAGLDRLLEAAPARIPPTGSPVGYGPVLTALTERANAMSASIDRGQEALAGPVATLAQNFDPAAAVEALLTDLDLFRLQRVIFGHQDLTDPVDKGGFRSLLEGWRSPPPAPSGLSSTAPPVPQNLPRKLMRPLRMPDEPAQAVIRMQDAWYVWQARRIWNAAWNDSHLLWSRPWQAFAAEFRAIYEQFLTHARNHPQQFDLRSKDLYEPRVGVAYLLPPEERGLEGLYQEVLTRLKQDYAQHLGPNAHEGHVLNLLLGQDGWACAYSKGRRAPEAAVAEIRQRINEAVTERVRPNDRSRPALIPRMEDLLTNAALRRDSHVTEGDLNRFRQKLTKLVPAGFSPDGHAPLKGLLAYPAAQENDHIERFLRREVSLPLDMIGQPKFHAVQADSIIVVLTRSSMGITEVPEVRRVIKLWADAQRRPYPQDSLPWRRRLNQNTDYLLLTEKDRQHVLHALLCAAWDGKIVVTGRPVSPDYITVDVGGEEAVSMKLELAPLGALSSWASVLQAYERWILTDDNPIRPRLAARLMSTVPTQADRSPSPPAAEFTAIVDLAEPERQKIEEAEQNRMPSPQLAVFQQFWSQALPAALRQHIGGTLKNLLELREQVDIAYGAG